MRRSRLPLAVLGYLLAAWLVADLWLIPGQDLLVSAYWWIGNAVVLFCVGAMVRGGRMSERVQGGRVLAIVPVFNEDPSLLRDTLLALIGQTRPPDEIHIVDDGSTEPVVPFTHPRLQWHRQENAGKRHAQAAVLRTLDTHAWDFVVTVDSDSVLYQDAVAEGLRSMRRDVMACTGMVLVLNRDDNLLTRVTDLNIGISCVMTRASRSVLGALETTSGAFAIYRAPVLFDNLDDYVSSGTYSDDRRLCLYALLRGKVVGVTTAIAESEMPTTMPQLARQRTRWAKGAWKALPFMLTNLRGHQLLFPTISLVQLALTPLVLAFLVYLLANEPDFGVLAPLVLLGITVRYAQSGIYLAARPGLTNAQRVTTWLFLTPLEFAFTVGFLLPIKFLALFKLRDDNWRTRSATPLNSESAHA